MAEKSRILLQLDVDPHPSVFDSVVAVDGGAQQLLRHGGVTPEAVTALVHGTMFTRGPDDLHATAISIGGTDAAAAEAILAAVKSSFFGPFRVSVFMDPNGANTTAAAAILAASRHVPLAEATATVLAATGPVGQRAVRLLACAGAKVRVVSRRLNRAQELCQALRSKLPPEASLTPVQAATTEESARAVQGSQIVIAAGAAGVCLLTDSQRGSLGELKVAIDLNAVPPVGLEGIAPHDFASVKGECTCYGALGVGKTKMKIHKLAIAKLFERNDRIFDCDELVALGKQLEVSR